MTHFFGKRDPGVIGAGVRAATAKVAGAVGLAVTTVSPETSFPSAFDRSRRNQLIIDEWGFGQRAKPLHFQPAYLSADETDEKVVFSFVPRPCTTAMIATEMPAAISPYSMAVAAVSSFRKEYVRFFIVNSMSDRDSQIVIDGFNTRA
jgi:hypothetical protein